MGKSLAQMWVGLTTLFSAFDILAKAILHLCTWAERTSKSFAEEAEEDRLIKQAERRATLGLTVNAEVKAIEAPAVTAQ